MSAETSTPPAAPVATTVIKNIPKPDKSAHEAAIQKLQAEIKQLQDRTGVIRSELDALQAGRGELGDQIKVEKAKYNEIRAEKDILVQQRNVIMNQLKTEQAAREQQVKAQKQMRQELKFTSAEDIDSQIAQLRHKQETSSMSLSQEKQVIKDIEALQQSKKLAKKFLAEQGILDQSRSTIKDIRTMQDESRVALDKVHERLNAQKKVLDKLYDQNNNSNRDVYPKLVEERKSIKTQLDEKFNAIRTMRTEFKATNDEYYNNIRLIREQRKEEQRKEEERRQKEYEAKLEEYNKEMAKLHPYQDEMDLCDALVKYLELNFAGELKNTDAKEEAAAVAKASIALDGMKPLVKKEEDFIFLGGSKNSKKNKKSKDKKKKFTLPLAQIGAYNSIGLTPPAVASELPKSLAAIKERKEYLNKQTEREASPEAAKPAAAPAATKKSNKFDAQAADFPSLGDASTSTASASTWGPSATAEVATEAEEEQ